jgi:adenosylmethionine-8-amino-7-oxononanoate aminotransferase
MSKSAAIINPFKLNNTRKQLSTVNIIAKEAEQRLAPQFNDIKAAALESGGRNKIAAGATVSFYAYTDTKIEQTIKNQINNIDFTHTSFFTVQPVEEIADFLIERGPNGLEYVYLLSDGSQTMESTLKTVRQYFVGLQENSRKYIIAKRQPYHGSTLGTLAVGRICVARNCSSQFLLKQNS